jgi:hypothetical protein
VSLSWALCEEGLGHSGKKIGRAFSPWFSSVAITWGFAPG